MNYTIYKMCRTLMVCWMMGFSMSLAAQVTVSYLERSWDPVKKQVVTVQKTRTDCHVITGSDKGEWMTLNGGWHVITGTAERKCFHAYGDVHLILGDDCLMKAEHLKVEEDKGIKLHIYSQSDGDHQGKMAIVNNTYETAAAIGSDKNFNMGSIYVHGGDIIAVQGIHRWGLQSGAVIGGGYMKKIGANSEFVVYGGKLKVYNTSKTNGAGIGGGVLSDQGGPVTIYGGLVDVYSQNASIGGGLGGNGGTVNIYGGKVIAGKSPSKFFSVRGAGIGGCWNSYDDTGGAGGQVHIHGGEVYAYGSNGNAAIGGSYNKFGGSLEVTGGTLYANGAYNPDNNDKCVHAPAIGGGMYGDGINLSVTGGVIKAVTKHTKGSQIAPIGTGTADGHPIYNKGTVKLGDMRVSYSSHQDAASDEKFQQGEYLHATIAEQRLDVLQEHANTFVQIESCSHQENSYQVKDEQQHIRQCKYCGYSVEENHTFDTNHQCQCGMMENSTSDAMTVTVYTTSDGKTYTSDKYEVIKGLEMNLPAPPTIEGLTFTGYLPNPTTAPSGIEMKDSERDNNQLLAAGTAISPEKNVVYYARYRYSYNENWQWNDKCTQATVTLTNPLLSESTQLQGVVTEDLRAHIDPTEHTQGEAHYWATATYNKDTDLTYSFEDCHMRILYPIAIVILDALDTDEQNTGNLVQYLGGKAEVTINNLTLKKDGKLHPICLPFNCEVSDSPLSGATLYQFTSWTLIGGHLDLQYDRTAVIEAGKPCFYRFPSGGTDVTHPTFQEVSIKDFGGGSYEKYFELTGTCGLFIPDDEERPYMFVLDNDELTQTNSHVRGFSNYFFFPAVTHPDGTRAVCTLTLQLSSDTQVHKRIAYSWAGDGSEASPYIINTVEQFKEMCQAFNNGPATIEGKYFLQSANIAFDKTVTNNFTPINNFNAHYDGAGHTISGLNIDRLGKNSALIDNMMAGYVKNVIIQNSSFKGYRTAAIAANMQGASTIENCHVLKDVTIEANQNIAAGIAAYMNHESAQVTGCTSQATVKGTLHVGGVVGRALQGNVNKCIYLGNSVTATEGRSMAVVASFGSADDNVRAGLYYTATTMTDKHAKLMPNMLEDNTDFLTLLHQRDLYLLNDHNGLTKEQIGYDITLNGRTMKAAQKADGSWQSLALSICPPFDIDLNKLAKDGDFSVYTLYKIDLDKKVMQFTSEFPLLEAGVPYMVVVNKGEIPLSAKNTTIVATPSKPVAINTTDGSKQVGWWVGTFKRIENDRFFTDNIYIAQRNKTFKCPPAGYTKAFIYPFVGYFSAVEHLNFQTFQTRYIYTENGEELGDDTDFPADEFECDIDLDDTPTDIRTVNNDGSMSNAQRSTYYDLQGRKLSSKPAKGVYIQHGQKVVIK